MVHGHANLDVLDNFYLHPDQCFGCFFGQKEGIFLGKFYFSSENFELAKFSIPQTGKTNHDLDVECKSQGVFLQFRIFTFLSFE
jgi:hypothetical protein